MNESNTDDLRSALSDVRRAYRLLWAYQKRVLEINRAIRDRLGFEHYHTFYHGDRPSQDPERKWVWDALPYALVGFHSVRRVSDVDAYPNREWSNHPRSGDALLYILVESDSAFKEARAKNSREPDPLRFPDATESKSQIHLRLLVNRIDRKESTNWHFQIVLPVKHNWPKSGSAAKHPAMPDVDIYVETFDLAHLGDEESVLSAADQFAQNATERLGLSFKPSD